MCYAKPCSFDFLAANNDPGEVSKSLKTYKSEALQKEIEGNLQESRREWALWLIERADIPTKVRQCSAAKRKRLLKNSLFQCEHLYDQSIPKRIACSTAE